MKILSVRELNRMTSAVVDALERGETFELRRNGKAIGYLTQTPPALPECKPDWKSHFTWLKTQAGGQDLVAAVEVERQRLRTREESLEKPA